ncbi:sigma-54 dependent transcriptional regulator [Cuneatibacter sp. NSJ-177]|uniref:sigma-54-dependent transcriptional regulator n=1 Tax=Cuneatibacter sp. NSJ-177 TaxID=2931401 RepID=UPI001FD03283|nr:sigma-54 dependent transcriptional regulator [Cuneatibacter sp. NSJ-177]MCJ7837114.1 sigma-54 dependent transcriptional regulator [Cuneatibacter sp. NSJ-177]
MKPKILIVDDEPSICQALTFALEDSYQVCIAGDAEQGKEAVQQCRPDLVLLDLQIGKVSGIDVLKWIRERDETIPVIMMTAYGSIRSSVEAMRCGAFTYLTKPLDIEELQIYMENALAVRSLSHQVIRLNHEIDNMRSSQYGGIIGASMEMQNVFELIRKVKDLDTSVTIVGESGTGKELVARAIHDMGRRKSQPFVAINCAAIPEGLLEGELFGHKRGAFTGAVADQRGKLEAAQGGILFLDEIGDMSLNLQSKLLRVLQEREYTPLGSNEVRKLDICVVAATNRDLTAMIREGDFRADLYYRLNVVEINLPPLRDRKQDIPLLSDYFIQRYNKEKGLHIQGMDEQARHLLLAYDYPGNVRELANVLEYAAIMCDQNFISEKDLPPRLRQNVDELPAGEGTAEKLLTSLTLAELEKEAILACYDAFGGKQKLIASHLGISERGLRNKLNEYRIGVKGGGV